MTILKIAISFSNNFMHFYIFVHREGGDIGMFITFESPKSYNNVFLLVDLTTFGTIIKF